MRLKADLSTLCVVRLILTSDRTPTRELRLLTRIAWMVATRIRSVKLSPMSEVRVVKVVDNVGTRTPKAVLFLPERTTWLVSLPPELPLQVHRPAASQLEIWQSPQSQAQVLPPRALVALAPQSLPRLGLQTLQALTTLSTALRTQTGAPTPTSKPKTRSSTAQSPATTTRTAKPTPTWEANPVPAQASAG